MLCCMVYQEVLYELTNKTKAGISWQAREAACSCGEGKTALSTIEEAEQTWRPFTLPTFKQYGRYWNNDLTCWGKLVYPESESCSTRTAVNGTLVVLQVWFGGLASRSKDFSARLLR